MKDDLTCPDGFTCNISDPDYPDWENIDQDSWTVTYTLTPDQGSTVCNNVTFENTVTLTENTTGETRTDDANIGWNCSQLSCWDDETAWAAGRRYTTRGNWATYTPYVANSSVILFAGQTMNAGTVAFSDSDSDGNVTITITLNSGWRLDPDTLEAVKVQGYSSAPSGNPEPGLFTTYKGSALSFTVPKFAFYGVHVDVEHEVECEL